MASVSHMLSSPTLFVVIVTYNSEAHVGAALRALRRPRRRRALRSSWLTTPLRMPASRLSAPSARTRTSSRRQKTWGSRSPVTSRPGRLEAISCCFSTRTPRPIRPRLIQPSNTSPVTPMWVWSAAAPGTPIGRLNPTAASPSRLVVRLLLRHGPCLGFPSQQRLQPRGDRRLGPGQRSCRPGRYRVLRLAADFLVSVPAGIDERFFMYSEDTDFSPARAGPWLAMRPPSRGQPCPPRRRLG